MPEHLKETLRILNSREKKHVVKAVKEQWGLDFKPAVVLMSDKKKVYIATPDIQQVDWQKYKVDGVGLYIGRMEKDLRLSIEGAQIIGPEATKNVLEISDEETRSWFRGEDITISEDRLRTVEGFIILKNKDDFLGCGKALKDRILNFVPKGRRIMVD